MRTVMLAAICGVLAIVTAAPAVADDETFVDALDMIGVSVGAPADAVAMGRSVCADFDGGADVTAVVNRLGQTHGLSADDAALVTGFSVAEYCDHHKSALGGA